MRTAAIQLRAGEDREKNIKQALALLAAGVRKKARLLALPECFSYRGRVGGEQGRDIFEPVPGPSTNPLISFARENRVFVLCGSVYESTGRGEKAYNTSLLIGPQGKILARYRKIHLFEARLGRQKFRETDIFMPGQRTAVARVDGFRAGLSICYDLRFPGLYQEYIRLGCSLLFAPSAFTAFTGKAHWAALIKCRAIETLSYVVAPNQTGTDARGQRCYGHSMVVSPWGDVLAEASGEKEEVIFADISTAAVVESRKKLPGIAVLKKAKCMGAEKF